MDRFLDTKQRVKDATDLVALLGGYLALRPRGRTLVALCPFHQERSPSFTVYPESQHYHCYGCSKSGDAYSFLMEREGYSFREAMEVLADRAGISLAGVFQDRSQRDRSGPDVPRVLAEVRGFFQAQLQSAAGAAARDYLAARGLESAIEPFGLGFHPAGAGALQAFAERQRLPLAVLEQAGLLRRGGGHEPLAGRLMFPIEDERGRVVAFGARVLPGAPVSGDRTPPKYLNSPESPFFSKRRLLYGLHRTKQAGTRRIIVVEGYTDVIACHLAGFTGAVATLGTAFTAEHARVLERYATDGAVLLFDGDAAGEQAAQRALRELLEVRLPVSIALLGDALGAGAKDPGDVLVARPGEAPEVVAERRAAFAALLDGAADAVAVWFRLLRKRLDLTQAVHLEAAARECGGLLAQVGSDLRREALLQQMARHLAMPAEALRRLMRPAGSRREQAAAAPAAGPAAPEAARLTPLQGADLELLIAVLSQPMLAADTETEVCEFEDVGELLALCRQALAQGRAASADLLRFLFTACAERPDHARILALAADRAARVTDPQAFWQSVQEGRRRLHAERQARQTRQMVQAALARGDRDSADQLTRQLVDVLRVGRPRPAAAADPRTARPSSPERT